MQKIYSFGMASLLVLCGLWIYEWQMGEEGVWAHMHHPEGTQAQIPPLVKSILPGSEDRSTAHDYTKDELLPKIANTLLVLTSMLAVVALILCGFLYFGAGARSELVEKARAACGYTLGGFLVALWAFGIVKFVASFNFLA